MNDNFKPPVHQLIKDKQAAYILQDGHHRSAIFTYLVENGHQSLLKFEESKHSNRIKVKNILIIRNKFLPHLKYISIGTNNGHFSLSDTLKWFDLAFQVLDLGTINTEHTFDYRLSLLHDKLIKRARRQ